VEEIRLRKEDINFKNRCFDSRPLPSQFAIYHISPFSATYYKALKVFVKQTKNKDASPSIEIMVLVE